MLGLDLTGRRLDAGYTTEDRVDPVHACRHRLRASPLGIGTQGASQRGRVHRSVLGRKHGTETGCSGGESLRDIRGFEPIAAQSRLALVSDGLAQPFSFGLLERQRSDALA